jgi:hypothetical protein
LEASGDEIVGNEVEDGVVAVWWAPVCIGAVGLPATTGTWTGIAPTFDGICATGSLALVETPGVLPVNGEAAR